MDDFFLTERKTNLTFIHVPKTGGTSVANYLRNDTQVRLWCAAHQTAYEHMLGDEERWNKQDSLCVVRNPWDAWVSFYFYNFKADTENIEAFRDWVRRIERDDKKWRGNKDEAELRQGASHLLQWLFYSDPSGEIIVDHIVRFEDLEGGLKDVYSKLDLEYRSPLPVENSSHHRGFRDYYDFKTQMIVAKIMDPMLSTFEYDFPLDN